MQQHKIEFILKFERNNSLTNIVKKVNIMKMRYIVLQLPMYTQCIHMVNVLNVLLLFRHGVTKSFFPPHKKNGTKTVTYDSKSAYWASYICLSGLFGDRPDQTNANKVPRCYRDTKSFAPSQTNQDVWAFCSKIGILAIFGRILALPAYFSPS